MKYKELREDDKIRATLRRNTRAGRNVEQEESVADLESRLCRSLGARLMGRPKKDGSRIVSPFCFPITEKLRLIIMRLTDSYMYQSKASQK